MSRTVLMLPTKRPLQLELFEAAPDVMIGPKPGNVSPPRHGLVYWKSTGDGLNWQPEIETHPATVRLKDWDEKLYGCTRIVIQALVEAGFVQAERISPRCMNIDLESWMQHRARMRSDPWFWHSEENSSRYRAAMKIVNYHVKRTRRPAAAEKRTETASDAPILDSAPGTLPATENARNGCGERGERPSRQPAARRTPKSRQTAA